MGGLCVGIEHALQALLVGVRLGYSCGFIGRVVTREVDM